MMTSIPENIANIYRPFLKDKLIGPSIQAYRCISKGDSSIDVFHSEHYLSINIGKCLTGNFLVRIRNSTEVIKFLDKYYND